MHLQRSCVLFGLGVMLNTLGVGAKMETLRVFGVLQRFGILYFVVASVCTVCWPSLPKMVSNLIYNKKSDFYREVTFY